MLPFNIGFPELVAILIIALIVFGPGKLPGVGRAVGDAIREFRESMRGNRDATRTGPEGEK